jgi:hypothetical protein
VKHLLTSVVREICMLRSVGAGERATAPGHPVAISNGRPYRDPIIAALDAANFCSRRQNTFQMSSFLKKVL